VQEEQQQRVRSMTHESHSLIYQEMGSIGNLSARELQRSSTTSIIEPSSEHIKVVL
jgi:hypothetical protein